MISRPKHAPSLTIKRANNEYNVPLTSACGDIAAYDKRTSKEHLHAGSRSQHEILVEFAFGEWCDIKDERQKGTIGRMTTDLFCSALGMNMIRKCGVTRKCEKKYFVSKSLSLEAIWDQLTCVISKFLSESSRTYCLFFLSIFYNVYNCRKRYLRAQQASGLDMEDSEWETMFMENIRASLEEMKKFVRPYVIIRIWYNGTGLGNYDAEKIYVEDVKLLEGLNYSMLRHSYKKIESSTKEFFELYNASVELDQLNSN